MTSKILAFSVLALFSVCSSAEQSKGVVILSHKSWTTQGDDPTVHVIDGHLT